MIDFEECKAWKDYNTEFDKIQMFNRIAEYFEAKENWDKLKTCWLIDGKSDEFRQLLKQAMGVK